MVFAAQLFAETSLCTLTSSKPSPILPKLLPLVESTQHNSRPLSHAAHTLILPLLSIVLVKSHDKSPDLREMAVHILCQSVTDFVSEQEKADKHVSEV